MTAALVPVVCTTALVHFHQLPIQWEVSVLALLSSLLIQIGTNLVNDSVDSGTGVDTEDRIGPQRVTQSGIFKAKTVMNAAHLCFVLALICGIPLVLKGGLPIVIIGLFSILFGYFYSTGPFPLSYKGWGDFFVILFFGIVANTGLYFLYSGLWNLEALILGLQLGLLCAVLIAINNLRDHATDSKAQKLTIPVRFGVNLARFEIYCLIFVPFLLVLYWQIKYPNHIWWPLAVLFFLGLSLARKIQNTAPSPRYNQFLAMASMLYLVFGLLITIGFLCRP